MSKVIDAKTIIWLLVNQKGTMSASELAACLSALRTAAKDVRGVYLEMDRDAVLSALRSNPAIFTYDGTKVSVGRPAFYSKNVMKHVVASRLPISLREAWHDLLQRSA